MSKINLDKIICINLKSSNAQQLFSISETYGFSLEILYEMKLNATNMIWVAEDGLLIAYTEYDHFSPDQVEIRLQVALTKKEYDRLKKITPIKTPKMPKDEETLNSYKALLSKGYDIKTLSMDSKLAAIELKGQKESLPVILEVDAILEKISKYGIESITSEEKKFLDSLK